MYKDKDKQREADKVRQRRYRSRRDTIGGHRALSVTNQGVTNQGVTVSGSGTCVTPKRGLDIKCFEDLPLDVQQTIRRISDSNEEFKKRTAAAIRYQHLFTYSQTGITL